jgi:hypothetical protein
MYVDTLDDTDDQADGSGIPKLGIIAACQLDGSLSFYAVPQPEELRQKTGAADGVPLYCKSTLRWQPVRNTDESGRVDKPLLKLDLPDAMCTCVEFVNSGRIICGTSTGETTVIPQLTYRLAGRMGRIRKSQEPWSRSSYVCHSIAKLTSSPASNVHQRGSVIHQIGRCRSGSTRRSQWQL